MKKGISVCMIVKNEFCSWMLMSLVDEKHYRIADEQLSLHLNSDTSDN